VRLILIRHGQTASNVARMLDTAVPGPPLNELGILQANALVHTLAPEPIEAIYASTQRRAQETAAPLAASRGLAVVVRDGLREIEAGEYEMRSDDAAVDAYAETFSAFAAGNPQARNPGGESGRDVFRRFDAVLGEIHASGATAVAVVSHGAMLRAWAGNRCGNLDAGFIAGNPLTNTGIVVVNGDPASGWLAETWIGEPVLSAEEWAGPAGEAADCGF
jgi:probable phosphoglycerate mutase